MNKVEKHLVGCKVELIYQKSDIFKTYRRFVDNIVIDNEILDNEDMLYITTFDKYTKLQQKNKQLKDNQVRAMNKIRDFIVNANCEIKEGKYSNDKHGLYWELFRENLTNIQKLIKGINIDEYVNIPKYREEELLNLEDNWDKLKEYFNERIEVCDNRLSSPFCNFEKTTKERLIFSQCLEKLEELEKGGDNNE